MAHRKFKDRFGHAWEVWEVTPSAIDPRRPRAASPARLSARLREGWLAFQTANEKRRLTPVPPNWETLDSAGLLTLLEVATTVGKPTRLIE